MRQEFPGFYSPSDADYARLWSDGIVILDANVLLDLYRLPALAQSELMDVLESLADRLWVPYQAALEFQRNRLHVIATERIKLEKALSETKDLANKLTGQVSRLELEKHGLGIDPNPLIENLNNANEQIVEAIQKIHQTKMDISSKDDVRDRLDKILSSKIGAGPADQAALSILVNDGEVRYEQKIPPGWEDSEKDKNPNGATYYHCGLKYSRKFGDLIAWRQILDHAKSTQSKFVTLITSEKKEDWWWKEQGKFIGPLPQLVEEIKSYSGLDIFWMYSLDRFLEHAKTYIAAKVSESTVQDAKSVSPSTDKIKEYEKILDSLDENKRVWPWPKSLNAYRIATKWLEPIFHTVDIEENPDIVAEDFEGKFGFSVLSINRASDIDDDYAVTKIMDGKEFYYANEIEKLTIIYMINAPISMINGTPEIHRNLLGISSDNPDCGFILMSVTKKFGPQIAYSCGPVPTQLHKA